jgi:phage pi2 protein 07
MIVSLSGKLPEFHKFTDIESFHNVLKDRGKNEFLSAIPECEYLPKIKLHGTNAGIHITGDGVFPQKRSEFISLEKDNFGFALWVKQNEQEFYDIALLPTHDRGYNFHELIIYGEWAGPGVQKGVAISQIPQKSFFVFCVDFINNRGVKFHFIDPLTISTWVPSIERLYVLPWEIDVETPMKVNFNSPGSIADFVEKVNSQVEDIEKNGDPYVKREFGIEGPGEGYVYYPNMNENMTRFLFKAKGEEHRVNKAKTAIQIDPDVLRSQQAFADKFVTEARCLQAVHEACAGEYDPKKTGDFLKWVMRDILKESEDELVASNLEWKKVTGPSSKKARDWFISKSKELPGRIAA